MPIDCALMNLVDRNMIRKMQIILIISFQDYIYAEMDDQQVTLKGVQYQKLCNYFSVKFHPTVDFSS